VCVDSMIQREERRRKTRFIYRGSSEKTLMLRHSESLATGYVTITTMFDSTEKLKYFGLFFHNSMLKTCIRFSILGVIHLESS